MEKDTLFGRFAKKVSGITGHPATFLTAAALVVVWAASGPVFKFSETWQLVINTGTTIITFLMVFIIQNTQNKDTMAMQLKLDELIRANKDAHNAMMALEDMRDTELNSIHDTYVKLGMDALEHLREGTVDDMKPGATENYGIAEVAKKSPAKKPKRKAPVRKKKA